MCGRIGRRLAEGLIVAGVAFGGVMPCALAAEPGPTIWRWPVEGNWRVVLTHARSLGGAPACLLMTGYDTVGHADARIWGLRSGPGEVLLIFSSANAAELAGDTLGIAIGDGVTASVRINDRPAASGPLHTVTAAAGTASQRRILAEIKPGSAVAMQVGDATVRQTVDEAAAANFAACEAVRAKS